MPWVSGASFPDTFTSSDDTTSTALVPVSISLCVTFTSPEYPTQIPSTELETPKFSIVAPTTEEAMIAYDPVV